MRLSAAFLGLGLAACAATSAAAQDDGQWELPSPEALDALADRFPEQDWYPEGYFDLRIAAEDEFREVEAANTAEARALYGPPQPGESLNLGDCSNDDLGTDWSKDAFHAQLVNLSVDVAKFRFRLENSGFPSNLVEAALLDYERWRIADILVQESGRDPAEVDFAAEFGVRDYDPDSYALQALLDRLNAARTGDLAELPEVILADGCGGEGFPVIVRTAPGNGQVWMISAFAFRVCTRRVENPWDKFACRWNEIETGTETTSLGGRYVYEIRWPDGTSRRGTREVRGEYRESGATTVTFRRTGS